MVCIPQSSPLFLQGYIYDDIYFGIVSASKQWKLITGDQMSKIIGIYLWMNVICNIGQAIVNYKHCLCITIYQDFRNGAGESE